MFKIGEYVTHKYSKGKERDSIFKVIGFRGIWDEHALIVVIHHYDQNLIGTTFAMPSYCLKSHLTIKEL